MSGPHPFNPDLLGDCTECPLPEAHPDHTPVAQVAPETPYDGTSGWSGSDTSHERAVTADADGTTSDRQSDVLRLLLRPSVHVDASGVAQQGGGPYGLTWKELADLTGWHHGTASGTLSVLHKAGRIARLTERRDRCLIYVLPEYVDGRETTVQGRKSANPNVVQREQFRVVRGDGTVSVEIHDRARADDIAKHTAGRIQRRVLVVPPWEDVE